jgi:hypothetical protein
VEFYEIDSNKSHPVFLYLDDIAGYYVISHTRLGDDLESRQAKKKR